MADFLNHLDGGACVNQRALVQALQLFGRERAAPGGQPIRFRELLDALWMLDLLVAHEQVSYDGTLFKGDLKNVTDTADAFSSITRWSRGSIVPIFPPDEQRKFRMLINSADGAFSYMGVGAKGLDKALVGNDGKVFFEQLTAAKALANALVTNPTSSRREELMRLAEAPFRGSKCVAGLVANGPETVERALEVAQRQPAALAASILINRFRFDYLRALARSAGDVYIPGDAWREFSHRNAAVSFHSLSRFMEAEYLEGVRRALESEENSATGTLPPLGLYCLMKADPTGGPRAIVDVAARLTGQYRTLLKPLTKSLVEIGEAERDGYVPRSGIDGLAPLEDEIEQLLTDELGSIKRRALGRSPSIVARYLTTIGDVVGEGIKSTASDSAKNATKEAASAFASNATIAAVGGAVGAAAGTALAATGVALAAGVAGAAVGAAVVLGVKGVRKIFYGHVDSYRALHSLLSAESFQFLNLGKIEERVDRLLGRKLVM